MSFWVWVSQVQHVYCWAKKNTLSKLCSMVVLLIFYQLWSPQDRAKSTDGLSALFLWGGWHRLASNADLKCSPWKQCLLKHWTSLVIMKYIRADTPITGWWFSNLAEVMNNWRSLETLRSPLRGVRQHSQPLPDQSPWPPRSPQSAGFRCNFHSPSSNPSHLITRTT